MADLDTLRPEVREAINRQYRQERCDEYCPVCEDRATIRAELLRLAHDSAEHAAWRDINERARFDQQQRAEKAEAELAALKARIFHGIVLDVDDLARGHAGLPSEWRGKRVRLVVEE